MKKSFDIDGLDSVSLSKRVGDNFKQIRLASNYTKEEMANLLQVSPNRITSYETGRTDLPVTIILKVSQHLKVSPVTFFDGLDVKSKDINYSTDQLQILLMYSRLSDSAKKYFKLLLKEFPNPYKK